MDNNNLMKLLEEIKTNRTTIEDAILQLKDLPFKDLDFVKLDHHRELRKGFGEVIYCKNKSIEQLEKICIALEKNDYVLYTRIGRKKAAAIMKIDNHLQYNETSKIVFKKMKKPASDGIITVLSAGTSDMKVSEEAALTAEIMGNIVERYYDVGVAGIHRLFSIYDKLQKANVIIAVAGMEGALPSVVSGLVNCPVIAVPTSVGYGSNFNGLSALLTMLNSCSPGISVVNIDNGFGAGYMASLINNRNIRK
jgi:pyridinium-3,5-biscarboxylic acid mononucleotide synthase